MQAVTEQYNPYADERWASAKATFELIDVDAADTATAAATSEAEISVLAQSHDKMTSMSQKIATMEPDYFRLDGSFTLPDKFYNEEVGWWSEALSDSTGIFETSQVLEFTFPSDQTSKGFTVIFDDKANEYAAVFTIETFDSDNALIGQDEVVGNDRSIYVSDLPTENYRKVRITFTKTAKPYRRVRVCEFVFGFIQKFYDDDITKIGIVHEASLTAESLPSNQLILTINNTERQYNIINPSGTYKYLQQGQGLNVQLGINGEMKNMGRFYFLNAVAEDDSMTAQITAYDRFYALNDSICRIGTTGTWAVDEAVAAVISDCGMPITSVIPSGIGSRTINKCIPSRASHREALRLIAQAAMCTCYFNRIDELIFDELSEGDVVDTLNNDNLYRPAKVTDIGRINKVEISVRDEYADTEVIYTATNKTADETDLIKSYDNPLVASSDVADWLLAMAQKRNKYDLDERGNPARETGDTIKIYDAYGENRNAVVVRQQFDYSGILKASTTAMGGI